MSYHHDLYSQNENISFSGYDMMNVAEIESENDNGFRVENTDSVQILDIIEFIYDHNNNHKRQCYKDEGFEICLEFNEMEKEMQLDLNQYLFDQVFSFEH